MKGDWMTLQDGAMQFRVSRRTMVKWMDEGRFPAYKLGRCVRLKRSEVEAWVKLRAEKRPRSPQAESEVSEVPESGSDAT